MSEEDCAKRHGLRHDGGRARARSPLSRRDGHRQYDERGGAGARAVRRQCRRLDRPGHRRRRRGACSARSRWSTAAWRCIGRPRATRSTSCAASAGRNWRPSRRRDGGSAGPHARAARRVRLHGGGGGAACSQPPCARSLPGRPSSRPSPAIAGCCRRSASAPLFDFGMRLGEASGAALAIPILKAAVACHTGMATFAEAGVSKRRAP